MPTHVSRLMRMSALCCFLLVALGLISSRRSFAQIAGNVLISPTRLVFEGPKRSAVVSMINIGDSPVAYTISLIHERMTEDGRLEVITTPSVDERFADDLIRIVPRQVILQPSVAQRVRVQLALPANLSDGEYRSHLIFRPLTDTRHVSEEAGSPTSGAQPGDRSRLTIPVIVRKGKTAATVAIDDLAIQNGPQSMTLTGVLVRSGNCSVYGDIDIQLTEQGGAHRSIGLLNGVAVYTPNRERKFSVTLSIPPGTQIPHGELRVQYRRPQTDGESLLAESTMAVP